MKPTDPEDSDESLDRLLGAWKLDAELPDRFYQKVRQGTAKARSEPSLRFWPAFLLWLDQSLHRPGRVITSIALFFLLGLFGGYLHRIEHQASAQEISNRYVQQVDPYQTLRH